MVFDFLCLIYFTQYVHCRTLCNNQDMEASWHVHHDMSINSEMDKEDMVTVHRQWNSSHKKEQNNVISTIPFPVADSAPKLQYWLLPMYALLLSPNSSSAHVL